MIVDADVIERAAKTANRYSHSVRATEAAELAAAFQVGLEVEHDARDAALRELLLERRNDFGEITEDTFVTAVAQVGWHEVLEHFFIHVARLFAGLGEASYSGVGITIVFDVHPANAWLHDQILGEGFTGGVALADDIS